MLGLDYSRDMLARPRQRAAGWRNVELVRGGAVRLEGLAGTFDAILSTYCFGILCDLQAVVEARLVPGGHVAFSTSPGPGADAIPILRSSFSVSVGENTRSVTARPHVLGSAVRPMEDCCNTKTDELARLNQAGKRRVLVIVLAINLAMFVAEFGAGILARSTALMADSLDMLGDAFVYGLSLYAVSRGTRWKAGASLVKGAVILVFGVWIATEVAHKVTSGITPSSALMGIFGALALVANVSCLALLWPHRGDDINMSSTFECSRNDVIANLGVLVAAAGVWSTGHAWPDIVVGGIVAVVFLRSAVRVLGRAWPEFRSLPAQPPSRSVSAEEHQEASPPEGGIRPG